MFQMTYIHLQFKLHPSIDRYMYIHLQFHPKHVFKLKTVCCYLKIISCLLLFHKCGSFLFLVKHFFDFLFREFCKRMDLTLPFYFFTLNERFRGEDEYPSFDECPEIDDDVEPARHPLCLHRLRINQREDGSIFVPGRAFLPARCQGSIRQCLHRPVLGQPPVPNTCS